MQTDTVRPAATVYFAARRIISELPIHRDTVLSHARDVDRAANELDGIEKLRARITRRASSGADTSQQLAMIESALESAAWHATTFHKVALASVDWADRSLSLLGDADPPEMRFPAVHAIWSWVALFADALKGATRESPPRRNEHPVDEHAIRAVVADQEYAIRRIRDVLSDETLVPLRKRADEEWVLVKMNAAADAKPVVNAAIPRNPGRPAHAQRDRFKAFAKNHSGKKPAELRALWLQEHPNEPIKPSTARSWIRGRRKRRAQNP